MATLQNLFAKVKSMVSKVYSLSPFGIGVALGYVAHTEIGWVLDAAGAVVKMVLSHL